MSRLAQRIQKEIVEPSLQAEPLPAMGRLIQLSPDGLYATVEVQYPSGHRQVYDRALMAAPYLFGEHGRPPLGCQVMLLWPGRSLAQDPWVLNVVYPQRRPNGTILLPRRPAPGH